MLRYKINLLFLSYPNQYVFHIFKLNGNNREKRKNRTTERKLYNNKKKNHPVYLLSSYNAFVSDVLATGFNGSFRVYISNFKYVLQFVRFLRPFYRSLYAIEGILLLIRKKKKKKIRVIIVSILNGDLVKLFVGVRILYRVSRRILSEIYLFLSSAPILTAVTRTFF